MKRWLTSLAYLISILAFTVSVNTSVVRAEAGEPYDYYSPAPDRLLENVEKYHLNLGMDKIRQGNLKEARAEYEFMLHYFPNHPRALQLISEIAIMAKEPNLIHEYFNKAIKLYPQHATTYGLYGVYLHKTNELDNAIAQYERALKIEPDAAEINYNLGLAKFAQKQYEAANQHAQIAYQQGYPLDGLKTKLEKVGAWIPIDDTLNNNG